MSKFASTVEEKSCEMKNICDDGKDDYYEYLENCTTVGNLYYYKIKDGEYGIGELTNIIKEDGMPDKYKIDGVEENVDVIYGKCSKGGGEAKQQEAKQQEACQKEYQTETTQKIQEKDSPRLESFILFYEQMIYRITNKI